MSGRAYLQGARHKRTVPQLAWYSQLWHCHRCNARQGEPLWKRDGCQRLQVMPSVLNWRPSRRSIPHEHLAPDVTFSEAASPQSH